MCETQCKCKCGARRGFSRTKLLMIVVALALTAGGIWVYVANATATRGTAGDAERGRPLRPPVGREPDGRADARRRQVCQGHVAGVPGGRRCHVGRVHYQQAGRRSASGTSSPSADDDDDNELPFRNQTPQLPFKSPFGDMFPFPRGLLQTPHQMVVGGSARA